MINKIIIFLFQFSLFYDLRQTKREMLKEFRTDLRKEKSSQNPITVRTYEDLADIDKIIIDRFRDYYRRSDNAVYLSHKLCYSYDGINARVKIIVKQLHCNIKKFFQTVEMRRLT